MDVTEFESESERCQIPTTFCKLEIRRFSDSFGFRFSFRFGKPTSSFVAIRC